MGLFLAPFNKESASGELGLVTWPAEANLGQSTSDASGETNQAGAVISMPSELVDSNEETWLKALAAAEPFDQLGAVYLRLRQTRPSEFGALIDALGGSNEPFSLAARSAIMMRWAEVDPMGMLAYTEEQPENQRWGLQSAIFGPWSKIDLPAALRAASDLKNRNMQRHAINTIVSELAETDPIQAIQITRDLLGDNRNSEWVFRNVFQRWARNDPAAARAYAVEMAEGPEKVSALSGSLSEWVGRDPKGALEWLSQLPVDSSTYGSRKQVFRELLNQDFEVAKEFVESVQDPLQRREILDNFYIRNMAWNKSFEELEAVFDWVGTVASGQQYDNKVRDAISAMAESDPDRAVEFALQMKPGNARGNALSSIASQLAGRDPVAALAFVNSLEFEDERSQALGSMGWQMSRNSLMASSQLVTESTDPIVQQRLANQIARQWAEFDIASALEWSEGLSDDGAKSNATQEVFKRWIQSEPLEAIQYADTTLDASKRGSYYQGAFNEWARQDPATAADWLERIPDSEDFSSRLYQTVSNTYVRHDPMAASEWIASLDEGPGRDNSVQSLVNSVSQSDPEAAFIWSETVTDPKIRKNTLTTSVRKWVDQDPDAAYEAVKDSKISAEEKVELFNMIEKKR